MRVQFWYEKNGVEITHLETFKSPASRDDIHKSFVCWLTEQTNAGYDIASDET